MKAATSQIMTASNGDMALKGRPQFAILAGIKETHGTHFDNAMDGPARRAFERAFEFMQKNGFGREDIVRVNAEAAGYYASSFCGMFMHMMGKGPTPTLSVREIRHNVLSLHFILSKEEKTLVRLDEKETGTYMFQHPTAAIKFGNCIITSPQPYYVDMKPKPISGILGTEWSRIENETFAKQARRGLADIIKIYGLAGMDFKKDQLLAEATVKYYNPYGFAFYRLAGKIGGWPTERTTVKEWIKIFPEEDKMFAIQSFGRKRPGKGEATSPGEDVPLNAIRGAISPF
ncbi:MAG: hypothetical protein WC861_03060 [Candidatus Micrarchaeia archaeon]|jgi:hypothetical protein